MRAIIKQGEAIIVQNIEVSLWERGGHIKEWGGSLMLSPGEHLELAVEYRLHLVDGRSGNIFVKHATIRSTAGIGQLPTPVQFIGSGELK